MKRRILIVLSAAVWLAASPPPAMAEILRTQSARPVAQTVDRLVKAISARDLRIFARIDHGAGAKKAGMKLRPMVLVLFGNPKIGTPLLQASPTMGLDLPLKILVWEDKQGRVWVGYTPPRSMARQRGIPPDHPTIKRIEIALGMFAAKAAK